MIKYRDLIDVKVKDNNESFVVINNKVIPNGYLKKMSDMKILLNNELIVRKSVYQKLINVQKELKKINPYFSLYVSYGYRSLKIQTKLFLKQLIFISRKKFISNPYKLYESVHKLIAVPTVAGHPTGGAVDLLIKNIKTNKCLDFGSEIYNFSDKCKTYCSNISKKAKNNRLLLRKLMKKFIFAPYDGE